MSEIIPVSIPWYSSEEDYKAVLALVPQSESAKALPYPEFLSYLKKCEADVRGGGSEPIRININAAAVKAWCETNKLPFCRKSISQYAATRMVTGFVKKSN